MNVVPRSTTFSVRPRSSVGGVMEDLVRRSCVRFPPRSKEFFLYLVWLPDSLYQGSRPVGLSWASHGTLIYTSELINSLVPPFVFIVLHGTTFICTLTNLEISYDKEIQKEDRFQHCLEIWLMPFSIILRRLRPKVLLDKAQWRALRLALGQKRNKMQYEEHCAILKIMVTIGQTKIIFLCY